MTILTYTGPVRVGWHPLAVDYTHVDWIGHCTPSAQFLKQGNCVHYTPSNRIRTNAATRTFGLSSCNVQYERQSRFLTDKIGHGISVNFDAWGRAPINGGVNDKIANVSLLYSRISPDTFDILTFSMAEGFKNIEEDGYISFFWKSNICLFDSFINGKKEIVCEFLFEKIIN